MSLIISEFKILINNFVTKVIIIYCGIYDPIIKRLYNLYIIIDFFQYQL